MMLFFVQIIIGLIAFALSSNQTRYDFDTNYPIIQNQFVTKCYNDGIGCFYTGPPWYHPLYRPVSVPPADELWESYLLYTRKNPKKYYNLTKTAKSLEISTYNRNNEIKVLVHGYGLDYTFFLGVKDALLQYKDFNVILIDWSHNSKPPYARAVANARAVAAKIALFLKFLMRETGLKAEDIHIIGHSLGGELVGLIGQRIKRLGRITGLDPAAPYYHNTPNIVRLDASDANFVDVIHSNSGTLYSGAGQRQPVGHANFYPNGGFLQPGFSLNITLYFEQIGNVTFNQGSHDVSAIFFQNSIQICNYKAYACFGEEGFKRGICDKTDLTNHMGYHATKPSPYNLKYYLDTDNEKPFCEVQH